MPRLHRVNHIIDFHVGSHIDGLPLLIGSITHHYKPGLSFCRIADGLEFFSITKANRTLQAHSAEFSTGPRHSEKRGMEAAPGHSLRSKAIPFTHNDAEEWYRDAACRNKHTGDVTNERGLLRFRPNHEAGRVA